jgi:hypothetical protein
MACRKQGEVRQERQTLFGQRFQIMGLREGALVFHSPGFEVLLYALLRVKADGIVHGALRLPQRRRDRLVTLGFLTPLVRQQFHGAQSLW